MKTPAELMEMVREYGDARSDAERYYGNLGLQAEIDSNRLETEIRAALTALAAGECSGAGLADDLRLVAQLESKRMGAMSSGLLKGVIGRLSALPPPPAEGDK